MRYWLILILVAICGCTGSQTDPPAPMTAFEERYPVVAGGVEVTIGNGREIIAPPGSATAGSKWIEHTATYTNKWDHPIWIGGYSQSHPFSAIEIRTNEDGNWHNYGLGYCGTGASELGIAPGASHSFRATPPVGQEFRVMLPYRTERNRQQCSSGEPSAKAHPSGRR